jgi:hypothetical protein
VVKRRIIVKGRLAGEQRNVKAVVFSQFQGYFDAAKAAAHNKYMRFGIIHAYDYIRRSFFGLRVYSNCKLFRKVNTARWVFGGDYELVSTGVGVAKPKTNGDITLGAVLFDCSGNAAVLSVGA